MSSDQSYVYVVSTSKDTGGKERTMKSQNVMIVVLPTNSSMSITTSLHSTEGG